MNYNKITETEFNKWAKELNNFLWVEIKNIPQGKEREEAIEFISFFNVHIRLQNTLALASLVDFLQRNFDNCGSEFRNRKWSDLGNRTYEEWLDYLVQRINQHHQVRINYKPDLDALKSRQKKIKGWNRDEDFCSRLFGQISKDKEVFDLIWNLKSFWEESDKKFSSSKEKGETSEEFIRKFIYLYEDYTKIVEQVKDKLNQENSPNSPGKSNHNSKNLRISKLDQEKKQLEREKKELEEKLAEQGLGSDEKKSKELELDNIRRLLEENGKRREKLNGKGDKPVNSQKDNIKLNWAIGLGIVAVVIGLICLILMASRRKER